MSSCRFPPAALILSRDRSDRVGRRPVIFIGLSGSIASITLFGLSKSLVWALLARSIGEGIHVRGAFLLMSDSQRVRSLEISRILGLPIIWRVLTELPCSVIQSIIGEITDATNEAQAMPLNSIVWNIGSIFGPMLGGILSTPARQYPNSFIARVRLFQDYPYVCRGLLNMPYSASSHC